MKPLYDWWPRLGPHGSQFTTDYLKDFAETIIPILSEYIPN